MTFPALETRPAPSSLARNGGLLLAGVIVATAIPMMASPLILLRATEVAFLIVAFSGLHVLSGRLGLISVGHGAFIGIGAVTAAHAVDDFSLPYLLAPLAGALGGVLFGVIIGIPSLRLPGTYLALLTLAVAMVLPIGLRRIDGPLGYRVDGDIRPPSWTGLAQGEEEIWQYVLVVTVGALIMIIVHGAIRGRFTRSLIAVRDEPTAAAAFGVNTSAVHLTGVAISAGLAGAAGGLKLYATPLVSGEQFPFSMSVAMFALMLALGASKLWTGIPAAILLVAIPEILTRMGWAVWEPIIYAAILLAMTRLSRGRGLVSLLEAPVEPPTSPPPASRRPERAIGQPKTGESGNPWLLTPEPSTGEAG